MVLTLAKFCSGFSENSNINSPFQAISPKPDNGSQLGLYRRNIELTLNRVRSCRRYVPQVYLRTSGHAGVTQLFVSIRC
jgi:hypothetical protein